MDINLKSTNVRQNSILTKRGIVEHSFIYYECNPSFISNYEDIAEMAKKNGSTIIAQVIVEEFIYEFKRIT